MVAVVDVGRSGGVGVAGDTGVGAFDIDVRILGLVTWPL